MNQVAIVLIFLLLVLYVYVLEYADDVRKNQSLLGISAMFLK